MSAAVEQLVVLAVREFQQARVSLEQAAVMLDMVRASLDPDAQSRVDDLTSAPPDRPEPDGDEDGEGEFAACPTCGSPLTAISVFGGHAWLCPDHGEIDPEGAPGAD